MQGNKDKSDDTDKINDEETNVKNTNNTKSNNVKKITPENNTYAKNSKNTHHTSHETSTNPNVDVNLNRRRFLSLATSIMGVAGIAATTVPFIVSWLPSARARAAGGPVEIDISPLAIGSQMTVEWRGKPVWIIRRSESMIKQLQQENERLRDPDSDVSVQPDYTVNSFRSIRPDILVLIGICTHLGCAPNYVPNVGEINDKWQGGFFCPCHGSTFDLSGRVFKGVPAPINLEVPPYRFVNKDLLVVGVNPDGSHA